MTSLKMNRTPKLDFLSSQRKSLRKNRGRAKIKAHHAIHQGKAVSRAQLIERIKTLRKILTGGKLSK